MAVLCVTVLPLPPQPKNDTPDGRLENDPTRLLEVEQEEVLHEEAMKPLNVEPCSTTDHASNRNWCVRHRRNALRQRQYSPE